VNDLVDISISLKSLQLQNPTILASGIMDEDAGSMSRILQSGAAAVVTKSIGLNSKKGHPNPTFVELDHGLLNAMGLPNPGIDHFKDELNQINKNEKKIIGSIFGSNEHEFKELAIKMEQCGVDAIELNVSCPHAKGYGLEIGQDPELIQKITNIVSKYVKIPVFVKLSPNVDDIGLLAKAAEKGNASGIVAINTVKAMAIDIEIAKPILANKIGGYSGKAIKPIGIRNVFEIYQNVSIPIIGVGGIMSGADVIEYIMAGATAVEIGSGVYYRGVDIFDKINQELINWMEYHSYHNLNELRGVAHL
jgi:dihydroorotate dehydrogenase (NAD+) catalytic subunit